ncbi:Oligopeptide transporter OPT superfamily [Penicillium roqueforti FM164]|uniref:Oligopeptide transporter OPT superfamily n=1 Tax=Penicillium roqueforti (strain FM164) TaxID=1365484 RepID=W6Q209_PENRF|nr:Oligopeptide transporter OPT superfamily [Penicillium roqueforti FM164]
MPSYYTVVSILLVLAVAMTGIRGLAESDFNAGSGLAAQLVLAAIIPRSNPNSVMINILSAAIANGGANQAGDLAFDLKIGQLIGAPSEVQTYGQIIGSIFGALVSCFTYRLFTNRFPVPGDFIQVPNSFLQVSTARMVLNKAFPLVWVVTPWALEFSSPFQQWPR